MLPDSVMAELAQADVILLGAVGAAPARRTCRADCSSGACCSSCASPSTTTSTCGRAGCSPACRPRWPSRSTAGKEVDFVVVREGTEGLYCGNGGVVRAGTPHEIATEVSVNTAYGVERVVRDAFERAAKRRNKITLVHKHNVLVNAGGLWNRIFQRSAAEYPQVAPTICTSTPRRSSWPPTRPAST